MFLCIFYRNFKSYNVTVYPRVPGLVPIMLSGIPLTGASFPYRMARFAQYSASVCPTICALALTHHSPSSVPWKNEWHRNASRKPRNWGDTLQSALTSNCKAVAITSSQFYFLNIIFPPPSLPPLPLWQMEVLTLGPIPVHPVMWSGASTSTSVSSPINGWRGKTHTWRKCPWVTTWKCIS